MGLDYKKRKGKTSDSEEFEKDNEISGQNRAGTYLPDDYNPNLDGKEGWKIYDMMYSSDTKIQQIFNLYTKPILQNKYYIYDNGAPEEQVKFFNEMFFDDINIYEIFNEALFMFQYGQRFIYYSLYKDFESDLVKIRLMKAIPYTVIDDFDFNSETGKFQGIIVKGYTGSEIKEIYFSVNELLMFFWNKRAEKPFGESMFRALYKNWKYKDLLLRYDTIRHERSGAGIVVVEKYRKDRLGKKTDFELDREAKKIGTNLRIGEMSYVDYYADEMKVNLLTTQGQGSQPLQSVKYHDQEMNNALLANFMNLGQYNVGSFAAGKIQEEPYLNFLNSATEVLLQPFNELIKKITILNWGKQERYVKISYQDFNKNRLNSIQNNLLDYVSAGIITPEYLGQMLRLPENEIQKIKERFKNNNILEVKNDLKQEKVINDIQEQENIEDIEMAEIPEELMWFKKTFDTLNKKSYDVLNNIKELFIKNLAGILSSGNKVSKTSFNTLKEKLERKMKSIFQESYKKGIESVRLNIKLADNDNNKEEEDIIDDMFLIQNIGEYIKILSIALFSYFDSLGKEMEIFDLSKYSKSELENIITKKLERDFSNNRIYDFSAITNVLFALGRNNELIRRGVKAVKYISVLDNKVCKNCIEYDNKIGYLNENLKAYITKEGETLMTPNPICLGSYKCRCLLIPI